MAEFYSYSTLMYEKTLRNELFFDLILKCYIFVRQQRYLLLWQTLNMDLSVTPLHLYKAIPKKAFSHLCPSKSITIEKKSEHKPTR
jgi:hypothetical protein